MATLRIVGSRRRVLVAIIDPDPEPALRAIGVGLHRRRRLVTRAASLTHVDESVHGGSRFGLNVSLRAL